MMYENQINNNKEMSTSYMESSDIMNVYQLKDMLRIGLTQAYKLLKSGSIKSIKVGKSYRISKQAVIDFINDN